MSLSVGRNHWTMLAFLKERMRRDLQFSRIFLVDFAASAAYAAATLFLIALSEPKPLGAGALIFAGLAYTVLFSLKILLVIYLEKRGGDAREFVGSDTLVTSGVYAFSRNPVYVISLLQSLAWSLGLIGLVAAAHCCAWLGYLLAPTLLYAHYWGMDRLIVPNEEAALRARHPEAFAAYCARVNRWFGRRR